jgi:hypothetical protein
MRFINHRLAVVGTAGLTCCLTVGLVAPTIGHAATKKTATKSKTTARAERSAADCGRTISLEHRID